MRQILFRGKIIDEPNEWVYGSLVIYPGSDDYIIYSFSGEHIGTFHVDKSTVGQYTGLKDKNGNKIFEGDIIKFEYPTEAMDIYVKDGMFSYTGVVGFEDCYFSAQRKNENDGTDYLALSQMRAKVEFQKGTIEILGNVFDNPELLELV